VYKDKSFEFVVKLRLQLFNGSCKAKIGLVSLIVKVASVTWEQIRAIAEDKMPDLNAFTYGVCNEYGCWNS
jgi:large subunit ribosomal protein L11